MAAIIRIDPDDELPAILERLPAGGACLLVLPPHARALNSAVGAKLLNRRAESLGSRVVVVTEDHAVLAHARAAGLPTAGTTEEAQHILGDDGVHTEPTAALDLTSGTGPATTSIDPRGARDEDATPDTGKPAIGVFTATTPGTQRADALDPDADPDGATAPPTSAQRRQAAGPQATHAPGANRSSTGGAPPGAATSRTRTARRPRKGGPGRFITPAALLIVPLLLLGWLASYVLGGILNPSATLTLRPTTNTIVGNTTVRAVLNLPPAKRGLYLLAMARVDQAEQATIHLPVRGVKLLPGHVATGRVELANTINKPVLVPAGTIFTTELNKVSFVSTRDVTLPAATLTFTSAVYGVAYVPIKAAIGGTAGNVPAKAIKNIASTFTGAVNVRNTEPTRGGTDRKEKVIDPHDLAAASASLFGALEQLAHQHIVRRFGGNVEQHTLYVVRSPVAPHLAPDHRSATLTLSVVVHAAYVHRSDLLPAALAALDPMLQTRPRDQLIKRSVDWAATWTAERPLSAPATWSPTTATTQTIALAVTGRTTPPLDIAGLLHAISGRSIKDASAYLKRRSDVAYFHITTSPPWADHVPGDVTRITVNVEEPQ